MAVDDRQWTWWGDEGEDVETFRFTGSTRDEVIAAVRADCGQDVVISLVESTQDGPFLTELFDDDSIDGVIERFADANSDRFGEDGFDGYIDHASFAATLNAACAAYFAAHGGDIIVWAFTGQRNKEVIRPTAAPA